MVDDTILGPFAILPVRPISSKRPPVQPFKSQPLTPASTAEPSPPPVRRANPYILFLILILLLASQGQLAFLRGAKSNPPVILA